MHGSNGRKRRIEIALLILMALTLAFIFIQSCLPPSASDAESEAVKGFLASIFPEGSAIGDFVQENVRKIAHFLEHGLFGAELALYLFLRKASAGRIVTVAVSVPFLVGFVDETIQIFSGRGPAVTDVWIDAAGSLLIGASAYLIVLAAHRTAKARRVKKQTITKENT